MNLLTQRQAAEMASVSVGTIAAWRKQGLRWVKRGNVLRIREEWLAEFLGVDEVKVGPCKGQVARELAEGRRVFGESIYEVR